MSTQPELPEGGHRLSKAKLAFLYATPFAPSIGSALLTPVFMMHRHWLTPTGHLEIFAVLGGAVVLMTLGLVPTAWAAVVLGYIFGWIALVLALIANVTAAIFARWTALFILNEQDRKFLTRWRAGKLANRAGQNAGKFVFLCRMSPVLPFATTNVLLALIPVGLCRYGLFSLLGMMPRTAFAVACGVMSREIFGNQTTMSGLLFIGVLLVVSCAGLWKILRHEHGAVERRS